MEFAHAQHDESVWRRNHARRLVQLLGSAPRLSEPRFKVLQILWPELEEPRARNRLHHTVHWIRKGLESLPASARPQLDVGTERVELILARDTVTDVQLFVRSLESDVSDDASRLACIDQALACHRGPLAPDWSGATEIEGRRAWLEEQFRHALTDAIELASSLGQVEQALRYALRRAEHLETDIDAHCAYAQLLAQHGRVDSALRHCFEVRTALKDSEEIDLSELNALARDIQQQVNRRAPAVAAQALSADPLAMEPTAPRLPAEQAVVGFDRLLQVSMQAISDSFTPIVSLVGPPGAGKTALAIALAHRQQGGFKHGVVWVDMTPQAGHCPDLLANLAAALCRQGLACVANLPALKQVLWGKEMLIVLDGMELGTPIASALLELVSASHDTKWLLTAWSALQVRGEKAMLVEPTLLLNLPEDHSPSPAAQVIAAGGPHGWSLTDKRIRRNVEAVAAAVSGLPMLLEVASWALQTVWPSELLARLDRAPGALIRLADEAEAKGVIAPSSSRNARLSRWLMAAPPSVRTMLAIAGSCRSWLTRDDLRSLMSDTSAPEVAAVLEHAVRHHYLTRRVRENHLGTWSEFRVPRFVLTGLVMSEGALPAQLVQARMAQWLRGPTAIRVDDAPMEALAVQWFDDHIDDIDALVQQWQMEGRPEEIAKLSLAHAVCWTRSAHATRVLNWLLALGEEVDTVSAPVAAALLVERAKLRVHLGQLHGAFEDAGRALARLDQRTDNALRQDAMRLIGRFGTNSATRSWPQGLDGRGIEAGESLLRVAQLSARHGALTKALQLCSEAVGVFTYFGLTRGQLKALLYRAKVAHALGDTRVALQCVVQAERAARVLGDTEESCRADLIRAQILISDTQHTKAMQLVTEVMARKELLAHPHQLVRALIIMAWGHYATGAYPLVRALCSEVREHAIGPAHLRTLNQAELLTAMVDARQGRSAAALRRIAKLLQTQTRDRPMTDRQGDLVNIAELVMHLGRPDLSTQLLEALSHFEAQPDHHLRLWINERVLALNRSLTVTVLTSPSNARSDEGMNLPDELVSLLLG